MSKYSIYGDIGNTLTHKKLTFKQKELPYMGMERTSTQLTCVVSVCDDTECGMRKSVSAICLKSMVTRL
jgi:hypothetical protein